METNALPSVKFYPPNANIKWLVRQFETIKSNHESRELSDNFIPRPDVGLVFNFSGIPAVLQPDNFELKPFFIATIPLKPVQLALKGEFNSFIVICNASVLSRIFKINLTNPVPVVEISDNRLLNLWHQLSGEKTDRESYNFV